MSANDNHETALKACKEGDIDAIANLSFHWCKRPADYVMYAIHAIANGHVDLANHLIDSDKNTGNDAIHPWSATYLRKLMLAAVAHLKTVESS